MTTRTPGPEHRPCAEANRQAQLGEDAPLGEEHSRGRLLAPDLVADESGSDLGPPTPHFVGVEDLVGYPPFPGHIDRALDKGRCSRGSSDDESPRAQEQAPPLLAVGIGVSDHPDLPLQLKPQLVRSGHEGGVLGPLSDGKAGYPRFAVTQTQRVGGGVAVDAEGGYAHTGEGEEGQGSHGAEAHDDDFGDGDI